MWVDTPLPTNYVAAGGNWWGDAAGPNAPPAYDCPDGGLISERVDYLDCLEAEPAGIGPSGRWGLAGALGVNS